MPTMLITRSTPRITYKIGMRAGLGALEDGSLPWLGSEAPSIGVAAEFTGIYRILMGEGAPEGENPGLCRYQSTTQSDCLALVWQESALQVRAFYIRNVSLLLLRVMSS